jgi:hypothetical protein
MGVRAGSTASVVYTASNALDLLEEPSAPPTSAAASPAPGRPRPLQRADPHGPDDVGRDVRVATVVPEGELPPALTTARRRYAPGEIVVLRPLHLIDEELKVARHRRLPALHLRLDALHALLGPRRVEADT